MCETLERRGGVEAAMRARAEACTRGGTVGCKTLRRLSCDARRLRGDHDRVARNRWMSVVDPDHLSPALRRALVVRDGGCSFAGLRSAAGLVRSPTHRVHWADGGETRLDNLVLLCRRHHRAVHEGGADP